jgi:hypothetical protein
MPKVTQMTLSLPTDLINATERLIKSGLVKTIDDFVTLALHHELLKMQRLSENRQDLLENSDAFDDPIWGLGQNPIQSGLRDASENIDKYLYGTSV